MIIFVCTVMIGLDTHRHCCFFSAASLTHNWHSSIFNWHSSIEIILMVFDIINHSYDSTHDSSPEVQTIVIVNVNKNRSNA